MARASPSGSGSRRASFLEGTEDRKDEMDQHSIAAPRRPESHRAVRAFALGRPVAVNGGSARWNAATACGARSIQRSRDSKQEGRLWLMQRSKIMMARGRRANSEDLALLVAVIDEGSLSAAGRSLGISTAMVSRRLQAMEDQLGVRLVVRTSRSLRATDEGADLCERAKGILADLDEACEAAVADGSSLSGTVRLLAPISFGLRQIAPVIGAFCAANPMVRVEMDLADRATDIAEGGYDLQISIGLPMGDSLVTRRLLQSRRAVCATPSYWERAGRPERPEDLRTQDCILLRRGRVAQDRWRFRTETGVQHVQVTGRLSSNSGEITRTWALAGLGIVLKSLWDVEEDLRSGALVEVFPEIIEEQSEIYICYPSRDLLPKRVSALVNFLATRLKSGQRVKQDSPGVSDLSD